MYRNLWILAGSLLLLAMPVFADSAPGTPSPAAQKIIQLSRAGVEEGVILAYIQTQTSPLDVTPDDFGLMKAAGVSTTVMTAMVNQGRPSNVGSSPREPLTEAQLYRLYSGVVYHDGLATYVGGGLPKTMQQELESDLQARPYIASFNSQNGSSQAVAWSGFGLLIGGLVYSGVANAVNPSNGSLNNAIGFGTVGVGVLSLITGNVLGAFAYQSLYDGLYHYNRDLVSAAGGNP